MTRIYLITLIFLAIECGAQVRCNKEVLVKRYSSLIPKEVCIPKGHVIDEILHSTDVDFDGKNEFLFSWHKKELSDGDTIFISVYKKVDENKHTLIKTFNNVFPINFKKYELSYEVKDKKLAEILNGYNGTYPFQKLDIELDNLTLKILSAAGEGYIFHYKYDANKRDWYLMFTEKWEDEGSQVNVQNLGFAKTSQSIDDFNYLKYMY
jgi:hypothetical protein